MPPKKTKKEQVTGEQASELILEYLRKQNRPYSIIEIVANLHDAVSKTNTTKALKDLTERELIKEKVSGKQAIYHIIQDPDDASTSEELKEMDLKVERIKDDISALKSEKKELEAELNALRSAPTAAALRESIQAMEADVVTLDARLAPLRAGTVAPVSAIEKAAVDDELAKYERVLMERKKMFNDFSCFILESSGHSKKELWEKVGLDDD
ncbi:Tat binding protein 1-interacting [Kalaharituber pfeilii]|nr:Tat binding protein 1-interacting [Kalaharituber pfeilii]